MNQKLLTKRNKNARLIKESNKVGSHRNCIRIGSENLEHFLKKAEVSFKLIREGSEIFTEVRLKEYKSIPDILVLDTGHVYEIMNSESDESIKKKKEKYPKDFRIIKVRI